MEKNFIFKENAFDFIRYWAAITVMLGHFIWKAAVYIQGDVGFHIISKVSTFFPGVVILFAMSGFLVSASFEKSKDKKEFFKNSLKYLIDGLVKEFELKEMIPAIWERYRDSFLKRVNSISQSIDNGEYEKSVQSVPNESFQLSTDDEKIIVYYLITEQVCNVEEAVIGKWFIENEIHDVNIKNGFMLLADIGNGEYENHRLALDIETFREMMKQKDSLIAEYENIVNNHKRISAIKFQELWSSMRDCDKLLAAYISDEKVSKLGMRWMANEQIEKIREWEDKKKAGSLLSNSYEDAMQFFIAEGFVYESGWTEYNSPKEYTLYKSLKEFLWRKIDNYYAEIREIMNCNFFVSEGGRFSC